MPDSQTSKQAAQTLFASGPCPQATAPPTAGMDLTTVLQVSEALSSATDPGLLLSQLAAGCLSLSGSDRCALLTAQPDGNLHLSALATATGVRLLSDPIEQATQLQLPIKLIQHVQHTGEATILSPLPPNSPFISSEFTQQQSNQPPNQPPSQPPHSLLCIPFTHHSRTTGILYLSHQSKHHAFPEAVVTALKLLTSQAHTSLEKLQLQAISQETSHRLEISKRRLENLFETTSDSILLLGSQGFIDCNQATLNLFGYPDKAQICATHPSKLSTDFQPDGQASAAKADAMMEQALTKGSHRFEWMHQRADGSTFWADVALTAIPHEDDKILHCLVRDISHRKTVETRLIEKSEALEEAMARLQRSQLQVVQNEKMASLGNLVAGVAHEVNNPIGFLNGSIKNAETFLDDLFEHLDLYQKHCSDAPEEVTSHAEEIDLDFLLDDFPKLLVSMKTANQRIKSISNSLRTFSRADTEHKVSADLHEGLDSTLLILKYRLKANEQRPAINIIKDYGQLPNLPCFPGQLNQVFMNILANAIDMFDEIAENTEFAKLKEFPQVIQVTTAVWENQQGVDIRIRDNGKGMTEEIQRRVFDHLFTTKDVNKGTGLGLAIAQQIVTEVHGGQLDVQSELGHGTEFCIRLPLAAERPKVE